MRGRFAGGRLAIRLAIGLCAGALLLVTGCSFRAVGSGDPGQRRLHELAGEGVFRVTPPGLSQPPAVVRTAAHRRRAGFGAGGWEGPSVIASFIASVRPATLLRLYDAKATATGWHATASGAYGVTDRWAKTYPDGTPAYLVMTVLPKGNGWICRLAASAPAVA